MKNLLFLFAIISALLSCTSSAKQEDDNSSGINLEDSSEMTGVVAPIEELTTINFDKTYTGKINGKYEVVFQIKNNSNDISGSYFYTNKGVDIQLVGKMTGANAIEMYELDYLKSQVSKISGTIKDSTFTGNWESLKTKQVMPIVLKETSVKMLTIPEDLEGDYSVADDDGGVCKINLQIKKERGEYAFTFKTDKREKKGKLQFTRSPDDSMYITFDGLKADAQGDSYAVEGMLDETGIVIQNSGNAMNPFTMIAECDMKYIHLVKQ